MTLFTDASNNCFKVPARRAEDKEIAALVQSLRSEMEEMPALIDAFNSFRFVWDGGALNRYFKSTDEK